MSRHVSTRHDTFDVSSTSRRACRASRAIVASSVSSRAVQQSRHSQNALVRLVECVVSCRYVTWRAKWNLGY